VKTFFDNWSKFDLFRERKMRDRSEERLRLARRSPMAKSSPY
jgi:hypothetical protein